MFPCPADDVHELLHAHVRAEAGLRDHVVGHLERDAVGDERVVAVRDVRERAAVHERGLALERLHEVRLDRVLQQHGHRAGAADLLGGDGLAGAGVGDRDRAEPLAEIGEVRGEREDRHHLGGRRDVEAGLAREAVRRAAEARDDVAQAAVVHVDAAAPGDRVRVDVELVAVHHVRVEERGEQVVGGRDRVHVAGEVEVQVLHRHDLRVAGAGRAALDAEDRPERGLAQAEQRPLADRAHALRERDRRRRLALAGLGRRDRRDADDLAVGAAGEPLEHAQIDLGLVLAVLLDLVVQQACLGGDLGDGPKDGFLGDLETALQRPTPV